MTVYTSKPIHARTIVYEYSERNGVGFSRPLICELESVTIERVVYREIEEPHRRFLRRFGDETFVELALESAKEGV